MIQLFMTNKLSVEKLSVRIKCNPVLRDEKKRILSDSPVCMKGGRARLANIANDIRKYEEWNLKLEKTLMRIGKKEEYDLLGLPQIQIISKQQKLMIFFLLNLHK